METKTHVCPVWIGYILANPLRKLLENPVKMLSPYIQPGMKILEIGPGMGFFSIPLAKMTGKSGKVYCVDIQKKMLKKLNKRAKRKGVEDEIELCLAINNSQNIAFLENQIDFCLLAYVVHEVPDQSKLFSEISTAMKKGAKVLLLEPKGHVDEQAWQKSLEIAGECGFSKHKINSINRSRAIELIKK